MMVKAEYIAHFLLNASESENSRARDSQRLPNSLSAYTTKTDINNFNDLKVQCKWPLKVNNYILEPMLLRSICDTWVRRGPSACMKMFRYHLLHTLILPHSENVPQAYTGFCTDDYILNFEITGTIPMYSQALCMIKIFLESSFT